MAVLPQRICDWPVGRAGAACGKTVEEGDETRFSVNDVTYAMDVCAEHKDSFMGLFEKAFTIARPVSVRRVSGTRKIMKSKLGAYTTRDVRIWLKENGYPEISDTGRISNELMESFKAAH
jgi:hypothetical protein